MSLAMKRLKNLGWLALVFIVAILLYPLSLNVAALHSDLVAVDREILDTKREISFLQAELRTRASLQQLEEWNELLYGYQPPTAEQFVDGERALAGLVGESAPTRPVMALASNSEDGEPKGSVGHDPTPADIIERALTPQPKPAAVAKIDATRVEPSRTERLAQIDEKLLSDDLMRDLAVKADKERKRQ
jgi:hypothetical protein